MPAVTSIYRYITRTSRKSSSMVPVNAPVKVVAALPTASSSYITTKMQVEVVTPVTTAPSGNEGRSSPFDLPLKLLTRKC